MALAIQSIRVGLVLAGLTACSPQLVDVVSGVSCCDDPSQPGCAGSGGTGGSGGSTGGQAQGGSTGGAIVSLVHRYTFRGDGIDVIDSIGTANGIVLGTTLDGKGSVSMVDGNPEQYVDLPSFLLRGLRSATFETWVTWSGGAKWQRIFDFGEDLSGEHGSRGTGRSYLFFTPDDGTGFPKVVFGKPKTVESTLFNANTPFPKDKITHTAVVVDANKKSISVFVDGGFQGSAEFNDTLDYIYDINNWLGRSNFAPDSGFNGSFHDFRIYNSALDANQILANYLAGMPL
jgi:uncharacterized protein